MILICVDTRASTVVNIKELEHIQITIISYLVVSCARAKT